MRVLLIQLKQIGDVLITSSMCGNIKKNYPNAKVDILVYEHCAGVIENNPYIDNIITLTKKERKNPFLYLKKILSIKKNRYDYTIDLLADMASGIITFFIMSKNRIVGKSKKIRNQIFYNIRIENPYLNTVKRRNNLITGINKDITLENQVKIYLEDNEISNMKKWMEENGINFNKNVVAMGINSRREFKIWKMEYFITLIDYLIDKYDIQVILYSNDAERDYALLAKSKIKNQNNVFTDIYTKNIRELAALLKNCDIFIGNEGGPRHIAESVGTRTFTVASMLHNIEGWILDEKTFGIEHIFVNPIIGEVITSEYFEKNRKELMKNRVELRRIKPEIVIEKLEEMLLQSKIIKRNGD